MRVRRVPIDLELLAVELAERRPRPQHEIIAALEAEVQRARGSAVAAAPRVEPVVLVPLGPVVDDAVAAAPPDGLPLDQLRGWLDQVQADLEQVQARLEFLHGEQHRLQDQQHLVAELITASEAD